VHGLNPLGSVNHALATWTASSTGALWLKDFLPQQIPNARIFLYSYNASASFGASQAGIDGEAEQLLNNFGLDREASSHTP